MDNLSRFSRPIKPVQPIEPALGNDPKSAGVKRASDIPASITPLAGQTAEASSTKQVSATLKAPEDLLHHITKKESEAILKEKPEDTCLLRPSESNPEVIVLSFKSGNIVKNCRFTPSDSNPKLFRDDGGKEYTLEQITNYFGKDKFIHPVSVGDIFKRAVTKVVEHNRQEEQKATESMQRGVSAAAKLGKGVARGGKAMVQNYWGEVIHDASGYGRQLHTLMDIWKKGSHKDNFNTWMNQLIEGKEVEGKNEIPKDFFNEGKLEISHVKFLTEAERKNYEMHVDKKGLISTGNQTLPTSGIGRHIFVLSPENQLYVGLYDRGTFNHSSFLSGGSVLGAGELLIKNGKITAITDKSGHYETSEYMLWKGVDALVKAGANLNDTVVTKNFLGETPENFYALEFYNNNADKMLQLEVKMNIDKLNYDSKLIINSLPKLTQQESSNILSDEKIANGSLLLRQGTQGLVLGVKSYLGEVAQTRLTQTDNPMIFDTNGYKIDIRTWQKNSAELLFKTLPKLTIEETAGKLQGMPPGSKVYRQSSDGRSLIMAQVSPSNEIQQAKFSPTYDPFVFECGELKIDIRYLDVSSLVI
jgi:hypothetical protein